jgi:hypothetical protein
MRRSWTEKCDIATGRDKYWMMTRLSGKLSVETSHPPADNRMSDNNHVLWNLIYFSLRQKMKKSWTMHAFDFQTMQTELVDWVVCINWVCGGSRNLQEPLDFRDKTTDEKWEIGFCQFWTVKNTSRLIHFFFCTKHMHSNGLQFFLDDRRQRIGNHQSNRLHVVSHGSQ